MITRFKQLFTSKLKTKIDLSTLSSDHEPVILYIPTTPDKPPLKVMTYNIAQQIKIKKMGPILKPLYINKQLYELANNATIIDSKTKSISIPNTLAKIKEITENTDFNPVLSIDKTAIILETDSQYITRFTKCLQNTLYKGIDIICLQEVEKNVDDVLIEHAKTHDYNLYHNKDDSEKVAILIKKQFTVLEHNININEKEENAFRWFGTLKKYKIQFVAFKHNNEDYLIIGIHGDYS
jgi:hypothetical protein